MPQVPKYDQSVDSRPIPDVRMRSTPDTSAFGGGPALDRVVQGVEGLAKGVIDIQDQADKARYDQERVALNDWERVNLYDPKTGASSKVGEQAFGISKELDDSLAKFKEERMKGLSNERQRRAVSGLIAERRGSVLKWADQHTAKQVDVVKQATYESSVESSKERAQTNDAVIPVELANIQEQVMSRYNGILPAEAMTQELQKHESDLHARVINSKLAKGDDLSAKAYFEKVQERLDPDTKAKLDGVLREGSVRGEGYRLADSAWNEAKGDYGLALEKVGKIKDPDIRAQATTNVRQRNSDVKNAEAQEQNDIYLEVANQLEQRPDVMDVKSIVPPAKWLKLTPEHRDALIRRHKGGYENNDEVWGDFLERYRDKPADIAKMDRTQFEAEYWTKFDKQHRKQADTMWLNSRKGQEKEVEWKARYDKTLMQTLQLNKIIVTKPFAKLAPLEKQTYLKAWDLGNVLVEDFIAKNNRKPSQVELQEIVDSATRQTVTVKGGLWGLLPDKQVPVLKVNDWENVVVPEEFVKKARAKNSGYTDEQIIGFYRQWLQKGKR